MSADLYIGLMSGTSVDAVDAVVASFDDERRQAAIVATHAEPFPRRLREELQQLIAATGGIELEQLGRLQTELTWLYAKAVANLLATADIERTAVAAIGCHGQTVRHRPDGPAPFTLQLGNGAALAALTGITTVTDFRSADIALGGEGAPLAPAFHAWAFAGERTTAVINIGGIGNITVLNPDTDVTGYDTGPGNTLMDSWCARQTGAAFDRNGDWARSGNVVPELLERLLADEYFRREPPKSTGREYFHGEWLAAALAGHEDLPPADVQATLAELTATTIAAALRSCGARQAWVCGGGAANSLLMQRLAMQVPDIQIDTSAGLGIAPDWMEAVAFAWLARERLASRAAGLPSVTGASAAAVMGAVNLPPKA